MNARRSVMNALLSCLNRRQSANSLPGRAAWLFGAILVFALALAPLTRGSSVAGESGNRLYADDFRDGLAQWIVEQQPGGTVTTQDGRLVIQDQE